MATSIGWAHGLRQIPENTLFFFEQADEVTLAYHRDDGKELVPAREFHDMNELLSLAEDEKLNPFDDNIYLFDGHEWLVWDEDSWRNLEVQLAYMNGKVGEPDNCFIVPCGDDCAKSPRVIAIEDEELRKLAEPWHRNGWRDKVVSAEEI